MGATIRISSGCQSSTSPDELSTNPLEENQMTAAKPGLYANIKAKKDRIAHGSNEHMRKPGESGAPTAKDFEKAKEAPATRKAKKS
jgi:gamma-glutamyl:cysteine ligase YbdK (ATP-grasp superfamily)